MAGWRWLVAHHRASYRRRLSLADYAGRRNRADARQAENVDTHASPAKHATP